MRGRGRVLRQEIGRGRFAVLPNVEVKDRTGRAAPRSSEQSWAGPGATGGRSLRESWGRPAASLSLPLQVLFQVGSGWRSPRSFPTTSSAAVLRQPAPQRPWGTAGHVPNRPAARAVLTGHQVRCGWPASFTAQSVAIPPACA